MDFYGFISFASQSERADIRSVLLWHRQRIYMAEVQERLSLEFISRLVRITLSYSYRDWYNPSSYPFCVHLPLIEISRTKFL